MKFHYALLAQIASSLKAATIAHHINHFSDSSKLAEFLLDQPLSEDGKLQVEFHGPTSEITNVLLSMGDDFYHSGEYDRAHGIYDEALKLQQENDQSDSIIADTLVKVSHTKRAMNEMEAAEALLNEAMRLHDTQDISHTLLETGLVLLNGGEFADAIVVLEEAMELQRLRGFVDADYPFTATALDYMGEGHLQVGDFDAAIGLWFESAHTWESLGDYRRAANTLNSIGVAQFQRSEFATAEESLEKAVSFYVKCEQIHGPIDGMNVDFDRAIANLKLCSSMRLKVSVDNVHRNATANECKVTPGQYECQEQPMRDLADIFIFSYS